MISLKEYKELISKKSRNQSKACASKPICYSHIQAGWRTVGGIKAYFRSKAEANYARYLQFQKEQGLILDWLHEPKTFWFKNILRGCRSYKPDFEAIQLDGSRIWYEVKGYYDSKSLTKIKRFRKYYPSEKLEVIDGTFFKKNKKKLKMIVKGWE